MSFLEIGVACCRRVCVVCYHGSICSFVCVALSSKFFNGQSTKPRSSCPYHPVSLGRHAFLFKLSPSRSREDGERAFLWQTLSPSTFAVSPGSSLGCLSQLWRVSLSIRIWDFFRRAVTSELFIQSSVTAVGVSWGVALESPRRRDLVEGFLLLAVLLLWRSQEEVLQAERSYISL